MTTVLDASRDMHPSQIGRRERLERPKPIAVNGVAIARSAIARETQYHAASKPIEAWIAAARALVIRELLLQEARRIRLEPAPKKDDVGRRETSEEASIRQLIEREVITPEPDEASCLRIYRLKERTFRSSDLYAVRHILLSARSDDAPKRSAAKQQAEAIIAAVRTDPDSFADFAKTCSACPSKEQGGALGQISRGQTVPEFEAALAEAPVGEVYGTPVATRYGVHVIFVDHKIEGQQLPFEMVHEDIANWLAERSEQTAIHQYIAQLAGRATITGIDLQANT